MRDTTPAAVPSSQKNLRGHCCLKRAAISIGDHLDECIRNAGSRPQHRILPDAELCRQLMGGAEADAANLTGQQIAILPDQWNGVSAIGLVDAHRPHRADAMVSPRALTAE